MTSLTIQFASEDDRKTFEKFAAKCKEQTGTPAPLWCGLAASVVRRAALKRDGGKAVASELELAYGGEAEMDRFHRSLYDIALGNRKGDLLQGGAQ